MPPLEAHSYPHPAQPDLDKIFEFYTHHCVYAFRTASNTISILQWQVIYTALVSPGGYSAGLVVQHKHHGTKHLRLSGHDIPLDSTHRRTYSTTLFAQLFIESSDCFLCFLRPFTSHYACRPIIDRFGFYISFFGHCIGMSIASIALRPAFKRCKKGGTLFDLQISTSHVFFNGRHSIFSSIHSHHTLL